ncbi:thiamine-phosphate kinase [Pseudoxanthomonas yeongjuensis]|uniref:thiamine-phosphate kinase n=1 Tax=Pseudoxanthomonas yeongjuensis TaxID=377616 RepID=UPI001390C7D2|nr:thiamine-phosphate kinase [Pseudoxanthomonas yeongjuensis]KAF1714220.1 thiamine-phosphate kinase [Pseudoxanthomonas yeongjuensis]
MSAAEFDLIDRIRTRVRERDDVVLGIGDDAALLQVPPGMQLVVTADTLNAGVHFPEATAPADIGWKSLAVNLSDLAAMGAMPAWCTLSLSMPEADASWVDAFLDGFLELADQHALALVGGDTTRGPLSISVTAMGLLETGSALRRDGARVGDDVWVTGTLGDAAAALEVLLAGREPSPFLRKRLDRPTPRVAAGRRLSGLAHSCIDLSDGLLADLAHVCERSGVGAEINLTSLPGSDALAALDPAQYWRWQASGGDDYELCFSASPRNRELVMQALDFAEVPATRIGRIVAGQGVKGFDAKGGEWQPVQSGYQHFP